jgi:DnaJ-domain-containing protein 1
MTHTYEELKGKTVAQLREIAKEIENEAVKGYTQMNKEHLLEAVCKALGVDMKKHYEVKKGLNKTAIKSKIRELKKKREKALAAGDHVQLKIIRHQIHKLKRKIRKVMV